MKHSDFVHLHNHSDYSLLDGASSIHGMVARAAELRMPALALTDHGSMFGAIEFYQEARKAGVKPIVGMEAYVTRGSRRDRNKDTAHHLVLLARDEPGFKNLMRLSSLAYLEGFYYKPRIDHEMLAQYSEGLLALSACPKGEIATDLLDDNDEGACEDRAHVPRHLRRRATTSSKSRTTGSRSKTRSAQASRAWPRAPASRWWRRTTATTSSTTTPNAHDVLLCIQTGKNVNDPSACATPPTRSTSRSADEMRARFADMPQAMANTLRDRRALQPAARASASRCCPSSRCRRREQSPRPSCATCCGDGLRVALPRAGRRERCRSGSTYELDVICRMGFASYFLIVRDFIDFARAAGIGVGPGPRLGGRLAGGVRAAHHRRRPDRSTGCIFERFLNPERVDACPISTSTSTTCAVAR